MSDYGRTEKVFGSGKNIWFDVPKVYPVGGVIDTAGLDKGDIIPAGSICALDTASGVLTIVASDAESFEGVNGLLYNDVIVNEYTTGTVVYEGVVFEDMLEAKVPAGAKALMPNIVYFNHA